MNRVVISTREILRRVICRRTLATTSRCTAKSRAPFGACVPYATRAAPPIGYGLVITLVVALQGGMFGGGGCE
jgi:hypothetical protein